jgi:DNA polymerase-3 subunit epsilon
MNLHEKAEKRQIFVDTETTGLDAQEHRLIEVACIELNNRCFTGKSLHFYVNPERSIDEGAFAVHGISSQFLADKPLFHAIADELFDFINGAQLVIHNAPFDLSFLNREFTRVKKGFGQLTNYCTVIDTLPIARRLHPSQRNNLDALCKRYKVDNSQRKLHGALKDAQLLSEVYLKMTGGQMRMDIESGRRQTAPEDVKHFSTDHPSEPLVVIKPSAQEAADHTAYLGWLQEQGSCVWEDESA